MALYTRKRMVSASRSLPQTVETSPAGMGLWAGVGAMAGLTALYLYLLSTDTVDALRGNSQWHIPYVAHPGNQWWWLPVIPGAIIAASPLLPWRTWASVALSSAITCAFAYLLFAAQWGGGDNLLAKILSGPTGFWGAAARIKDLRATLADYPAYLRTVEASSHVASHPPGDVLFFRALNDLMAGHIGLTNAVLAFGRPFISGIPMLLNAGNPPYLMAGAIAAIPVIIILGRVAVVPIAGLANRLGAPALAASLLFLVLPTTLVHVPLLDTVFPLLTGITLLVGLAGADTANPWLALLTGVLLGFSLFFTLGVVVVLIPLATYLLLRRGWRSTWLAVPLLAGWLFVWLGLWVVARINMIAIIQQLDVHQQQWESRYTYWLWFRWKWYDFAMFCGIPIALLCIKFLVESSQRWRRREQLKIDLFFAGWLLMMIFLWVTPSAMAEVGRLWAPLMCFAVLFAAHALPRSRWPLAAVLALEIAQVMVINRYLEVINSG